MSDSSKIEWTDATWNVVTGCTKVSPGCDHCYAETFAERWRGTPGHHFENGFDVQLRPERLDLPLKWRKPRRIFVNSMSDLFHEVVTDKFIGRVFETMGAAKQHTFQLLTKRHGRMRSLLTRWTEHATKGCYCPPEQGGCSAPVDVLHGVWPLPNVWLGVSVENQQWADIRITHLLQTPAVVRFLSAEPLLGPIDLSRVLASATPIDWVIAGGESGRAARPMHPDWARSLRDQCQAAGIAFLFKQHGEWEPLGPLYGDLEETDEGHMEAVHLEAVEGKTVIQLERDGYVAEGHQPGDSRTWLMARVGKKRAGRLLDGREWNEFPETREVAIRG